MSSPTVSMAFSLPFLANVRAVLASFVAPPVLPFAEFVALITGLITLYGAFQGVRAWYSWHTQRTPVELEFDWLSPIVNVILDASHLGAYVLLCATGSALVMLTFPVSVPILIARFGKRQPPQPQPPQPQHPVRKGTVLGNDIVEQAFHTVSKYDVLGLREGHIRKPRKD